MHGGELPEPLARFAEAWAEIYRAGGYPERGAAACARVSELQGYSQAVADAPVPNGVPDADGWQGWRGRATALDAEVDGLAQQCSSDTGDRTRWLDRISLQLSGLDSLFRIRHQ